MVAFTASHTAYVLICDEGGYKNLMPIEQLFSEHDIQNLINKNFAPPFGERNAALVAEF